MISRIGVRGRFIGGTSIVFIIAYVVLATALYQTADQWRIDRVDSVLLLRATSAQNQLADAAEDAAGPGIDRIPITELAPARIRGILAVEQQAAALAGVLDGPAVIQISDRAGTVVAATPDATVVLPVPEGPGGGTRARTEERLSTVEVEGTTVRLATLRRPEGFVQVGFDIGPIEEQQRTLLLQLVAGGLVALGLTVGATMIVARFALAPLRSMERTAQRVAATESPSERIAPLATRDEIADLTRAFNTMLDRLESTQQRLTDSLGAQRRFVADASHGLRTPVTALRGSLEVLDRYPGMDPDDRADLLRNLISEADRLVVMCNELLELARSENSDASRHRSGRLAEVTAEWQAHLAPLAAADDRRVNLAPETREDLVIDGAEVVRRILDLVGENALVHGEGTVTLSTAIEAGSLVVTVSDEGPGIPADEQDMVFDRFHRGSNSQGRPGTGLGLSIAANLASGLGGTLTAIGARFELRLPVIRDAR